MWEVFIEINDFTLNPSRTNCCRGMSEEEANDLQCLFSGTITEILQDPSSNQDPKSGRVSFSSCHYEAGFVFAHFIRVFCKKTFKNVAGLLKIICLLQIYRKG